MRGRMLSRRGTHLITRSCQCVLYIFPILNTHAKYRLKIKKCVEGPENTSYPYIFIYINENHMIYSCKTESRKHYKKIVLHIS